MAGWYYVTICTKDRKEILGEIHQGQMKVNMNGWIVQNCWMDLTNHYSHIHLDEFIVMPNHLHGIVCILDDTDARAGHRPAPTHGLSEIVRALKSYSAQRINIMRGAENVPVWQRNYFEHIIRDEKDLDRIRQYIIDNPSNWGHDEMNVL